MDEIEELVMELQGLQFALAVIVHNMEGQYIFDPTDALPENSKLVFEEMDDGKIMIKVVSE